MSSSSAPTLDLADATWANLAAAYQNTEAPEVRAFLAVHPELPSLLLEIREAVRPYFGDDPMALEIFLDTEWDEAEPELVAVIKTRRRQRGENLARLKAFDHNWWLAKLAETRPPIIVSYDVPKCD